MYPEQIVAPMRAELTAKGFKELKTEGEVDSELQHSHGTVLVAVNSICGCAAGAFRPALIEALKGEKKPTKLFTVFAGQDKAATDKARSYMLGYPPSSPSAALFKDGEVVFMLERKMIEGFSPMQITERLKKAFLEHC